MLNAIEVIPVQVPAGTAATIPITTNLQYTDRIVVVASKSITSGTPQISGLDLFWRTLLAQPLSGDLWIWTATDRRGAGSIVVTPNSSTAVTDVVVYVLRTDQARTLIQPVESVPTKIDAAYATGQTVYSPIVTVPAGGIAIAVDSVLGSSGAAITFPAIGSTPAAGSWVVDSAVRSRIAHASLATETLVSVGLGLAGGSPTSMVLALAAFYEEPMPDYVLEFHRIWMPSSPGTLAIPLDSVLEAGDLVVVSMTYFYINSAPTVASTPAATWTVHGANSRGNIQRHHIRSASGLVGASTINISGVSGDASEIEVTVFRGLASPTFHAIDQSTDSTTTSGGLKTAALSDIGEGQLLVALAHTESPAGNVWPAQNTPGDDWYVPDRNNGRGGLFTAVRLVDGPIDTAMSGFVRGTVGGVSLLAFGTATDGPDTPRIVDMKRRELSTDMSTTFTTTVSLVPNDVVVVLEQRTAIPTFAITLNGVDMGVADIARRLGAASGDFVNIYFRTGLTGVVTFGLTTVGTGSGEVQVLVFRGLEEPTVRSFVEAGFDGAVIAEGSNVRAPDIAATAGQGVVHFGTSTQNSFVFGDGIHPTDGWSRFGRTPAQVNKVSVLAQVLEETPLAPGISAGMVAPDVDGNYGMVTIVLGEATLPPDPPSTSGQSVGIITA